MWAVAPPRANSRSLQCGRQGPSAWTDEASNGLDTIPSINAGHKPRICATWGAHLITDEFGMHCTMSSATETPRKQKFQDARRAEGGAAK